MIKGLLRNVRLTWRLLRDPRVPVLYKLLIPLAIAYLLYPLDLIRDWIPHAGFIDDLVAIGLALYLFRRICPRHLVEEHRQALARRRRRRDNEIVTDVDYEVLDD